MLGHSQIPITPNMPDTVERTLGGAGSQPDPNNIKSPGALERRLGNAGSESDSKTPSPQH